MSGRRDLRTSFSLLTGEERWFLPDALVGAIVTVVWVAGTAALVDQVAALTGLPLSLAAGDAPTTAAVTVHAALWLVGPALAVVVRLRQRLRNIRGNVHQRYRLDHPAALLAPAAVLVFLALPVAALESVPRMADLVLVVASLFALVRTVAFSYRVYAFSRPLLLQVAGFAATCIMLAGAFATVGLGLGERSFVASVVAAAGLPASVIQPVTVGSLAVPTPTVALLAPVLACVAYVTVQTLAAVAVRVIGPTVDRTAMRSGQRYPPFLDAATPVRDGPGADSGGSPAKAPGQRATPADDGDDAESASEPATDQRPDDGDGDSSDGDLDDVSNTRVFTPPTEGDDAFDGVSGSGASDDGTEDGAGTTEAGRADPPANADETDGSESESADDGTAVVSPGDAGEREHCDACGGSFTVDTTVRFCPNCGAALDAG